VTLQNPDPKEVVDQLVLQQFFIPPNIITDRTYTIKFQIEGSEMVVETLTDLLYERVNSLVGTEPDKYLDALLKIGKKLSINPIEQLEERFEDKIGSFIKEGLATPTILLIATISSLLEVLDYNHHQMLLKELSAVYYHQCISRFSTEEYEEQCDNLDAGIRRLSEAAEAKLSLLQNIIKLKSLASIFDLTDYISYDKRQLQNFQNEIIQKIINGTY